MSAVQLSFEAQGLDPSQLAAMPAHERRHLYDDLDLDALQRQAAEDAVRLVRAEQYRRAT